MVDGEKLVPALQAGDADAWEQLFNEWYPLAYRAAYLITNDQGKAEDAVQEAFCQAIKSIGSLRDKRRLKAWLHVIVNRAAIDQVRRGGGNRNVILADLQETASTTPMDSLFAPRPLDPEEAAEVAWEAEVVARALQELPIPFRQVTILFYYQQLSVAEIAAELNCAEGTVKSRLSRARARLYDLLSETMSPDEGLRRETGNG